MLKTYEIEPKNEMKTFADLSSQTKISGLELIETLREYTTSHSGIGISTMRDLLKKTTLKADERLEIRRLATEEAEWQRQHGTPHTAHDYETLATLRF